MSSKSDRPELFEHEDTVDAVRVPAGPDPLTMRAPWVIARRYEILSLLGSGAMGTVYRVRDRELDEVVALKMLKKRVTGWVGNGEKLLESIRREVKLSRRVTHVNIARTFDIGDTGPPNNGKFITMEFIDGQTLRALLARRTKLSLSEAIRIGLDLCAGLGAAHVAGVLHRDLKPENVILGEGGRAVITDFGIARALTDGVLHQSGALAGTPAYMAPEQLEARSALDARVDVYALGTIFFELVTGHPAWDGPKPIDVAMARMREPPPDPRKHDPSLSPEVADFVLKCMAQRRDDRFAGTREVQAALDVLIASRGVSMPPPVASRPSRVAARSTLAILPIVNLAGESYDYLVEHLVEDLVDMLGGIPEVRVRQRGTGAFGAEPNRDPRSIGGEIGVDSVVDGTLSLSARPEAAFTGAMPPNPPLVLGLKLVTVEDGIELWGGRFERLPMQIPAVADEAAVAIADVLSAKAGKRASTLGPHTEAQDLYLRGRYTFNRGWFDPDGAAVRLLREAHVKAPEDAAVAATYARALARSYGLDSLGGTAATTAMEIADLALTIDPDNAEARVARAMVHLYQGDALAAAFELKRAIARRPDDPSAREMLGRFRSEVGALGQAIEQLTAAIAKEPSAAQARATASRAWALLGNWERAEAALGEEPVQPIALVPHLLARARLALWREDGRRAESLVPVARKVRDVGPTLARIAETLLGVTLTRTISPEDRAWLVGVMPSGASIGPSRACFNAQLRAEILVAAGDVDGAMEAVRDADANALLDLMWLKRCPMLEPLRTSGALAAVDRSTSLRAARVRETLD